MAYGSRPTVSVGERILANLDFIGEVFKDYRSEELPDVPFLELARSFELSNNGDW
jgi:hypothetical protein